jgi:hypothetical protein
MSGTKFFLSANVNHICQFYRKGRKKIRNSEFVPEKVLFGLSQAKNKRAFTFKI